MKKIFCFTLIIFLVPMVVSAFSYRMSNYSEIGTVYFENSTIEFYKGSVYTYNDNNLYLDGKLINYDSSESPTSYGTIEIYNNTKRTVLKDLKYNESDRNVNFTAYIETVPSDAKVHCFGPATDQNGNPYIYGYYDSSLCDDFLEEGKNYSSKDILYVSNGSMTAIWPHFYYKDEVISYNNSAAYFFPKIDGKETYWISTGVDSVGYKGCASPVFEAYIPPKFEFKCEPKVIKYGETSKCTLYGTVDNNLKNLNFDIDPKEYKVLGSSFPEGITNDEGNKQYNLKISENYDQSKEGFVLGVFEITGAQNKKYTDNVKIINLDYVDERVSGEYSDLEDPVEIVAFSESSSKEIKEEKNPETKSFSVMIPLILFISTCVIFYILDKKKKIKKIS